mmetsp:Transcript_1619/g.4138  ORF Transcript_1619/g.4138 Transcript_1619/m.4138 type:complete len:241 (-) Transcript_1619:685-1407(-)
MTAAAFETMAPATHHSSSDDHVGPPLLDIGHARARHVDETREREEEPREELELLEAIDDGRGQTPRFRFETVEELRQAFHRRDEELRELPLEDRIEVSEPAGFFVQLLLRQRQESRPSDRSEGFLEASSPVDFVEGSEFQQRPIGVDELRSSFPFDGLQDVGPLGKERIVKELRLLRPMILVVVDDVDGRYQLVQELDQLRVAVPQHEQLRARFRLRAIRGLLLRELRRGDQDRGHVALR